MEARTTVWSGTVPLPPNRDRRQSTSLAAPASSARAPRGISLHATTQDPLNYDATSRATRASSDSHRSSSSTRPEAGPAPLRLPRSRTATASSTASLSRARTPSHGSTASSASSDFPVTPAAPPTRRKSSAPADKGKGRETWNNGIPVLGPMNSAVSRGRSLNMVDPRFSFSRPFTGVNPVLAATDEPSFVASLSSKPFLGPSGTELPLFSSPPPAQIAYLPTSPIEAAFPQPPSPFSPTSPVASISTTPPRATISAFLPHFASSSSPTKSFRKTPSTTATTPTQSAKRRSTSFSRRVRRRSSPRKPASIRRHSSSSSPRRRDRSRSPSVGLTESQTSPARTRRLRHRSHSVPDLRSHVRTRSVPTPIPFDTFSPRSPYTREGETRQGARRSSIADELLFGDSASSRQRVGTNGLMPSSLLQDPVVIFPSRRSRAVNVKGKRTPGAEPVPRTRAPQNAAPTRPNGPRVSGDGGGPIVVRSRIKSSPVVKGSWMVPHPRLLVSDPDEEGGSDEYDVDAIKRRYRAGAAAANEYRLGGKGEDAQSDVDHSSLLRVLRENEESRKEREAWSDSATKSLGLGFGFKWADSAQRNKTHTGGTMRGRGNLAFGGRGGAQTKVDRKKVRKQVERDKWRAAESGTDGEGPPRQRRTRPAVPEASPPMPHSFEPFMQLGRRLSLSKSKSRKHADAAGKERTDFDTLATPRTVRGKPIRHLRTSPSVDSIYARTSPATEYGQALSENVPLGEEHRRPSLTNQNAFLSLPPHLHHLLRSPERESYEPSRSAPPVPSLSSQHSVAKDSNRLSTSSVASAARLALALESHLSQLKPGPSPLTRPAETTFARSGNADQTRAPVGDGTPTGRGTSHPYSLSPLPEVESPDSQPHSDASSSLHVDNGNNWPGLFFSPPRRQSGSLMANARPTVSIMVASDDETSTEGTDDTFSIRRLERTRQSLEALYTTANDPDTAQETLLLPTTVNAPSFSRSTSRRSSAQASFVTARETMSHSRTRTPDSGSARPLPSPAQTPWPSTSFAREYLDGVESGPGGTAIGRSNRDSDPVSLASSNRASSRGSKHSYIDFDVEEDDVDPNRDTPEPAAASPSSFLDDFSPPSSAPPSPVIGSFPARSQTTAPPLLPAAAPFEPGSLPTSPTLTSTFDDAESRRFSRTVANRESYLSVDSQNLHISPTAARFANGGNTARTSSHNSSRSAVLNSFPVPPVEEEQAASDGDDEEEEEDEGTEQEGGLRAHRCIIAGAPNPASRLSALATRHETFDETTNTPSTSSSPTAATNNSPSSSTTSALFPARSETSNSFLDVSEASDSESKRWSRGTFQTFYYGKRDEPLPPLPPARRY